MNNGVKLSNLQVGKTYRVNEKLSDSLKRIVLFGKVKKIGKTLDMGQASSLDFCIENKAKFRVLSVQDGIFVGPLRAYEVELERGKQRGFVVVSPDHPGIVEEVKP